MRTACGLWTPNNSRKSELYVDLGDKIGTFDERAYRQGVDAATGLVAARNGACPRIATLRLRDCPHYHVFYVRQIITV